MYRVTDTIIAVSSPTADQRTIIRISGPAACDTLRIIFKPTPAKINRGITGGVLEIEAGLEVDAVLYLFAAPHSYTGEDIAEMHFCANRSISEALISKLLAMGLRTAEPGEFAARAYLNNKIDLAQAEAVNEIITSSNRCQLAAAEKMLAGDLAKTTRRIAESILDCLSEIEAGLDFSGEGIEFAFTAQAQDKLSAIKRDLDNLLATSIRCESMIDLPAVGIAGAPNAGKSTLLNKLLGKHRSIVSAKRKTTRDVLTGELTLTHSRCVIFDCAGLIVEPQTVLDKLAQQAGVEALRNAIVVIFCVDVSKPGWDEDIEVFRLMGHRILVPVATKSDLLDGGELHRRLAQLSDLFNVPFVGISAKTGDGLAAITELIDKKILEQTSGAGEGAALLTVRHRQAATEAIENIDKAVSEIRAGNDEVAAMMLRAAHQAVSAVERHDVAEDVLERIFSRFCIGK